VRDCYPKGREAPGGTGRSLKPGPAKRGHAQMG
jgi:hypothetical protein